MFFTSHNYGVLRYALRGEKTSYLSSFYKNKKEVACILRYAVPNFQSDKDKTDGQNNLKV